MKSLIILALLLPGLVQAHTPNGKEECLVIAKLVAKFAVSRDHKISKDDVSRIIQKNMQEVMGDEDSIIQDREDVQRMLGLLDEIYKSKIGPADAAQQVYINCLGIVNSRRLDS